MLNLATVIIASQAKKATYEKQGEWGDECLATDRQQSPIDLAVVAKERFEEYDQKIELTLPTDTDTKMKNFTKVTGTGAKIDTIEGDGGASQQLIGKVKLKIGEGDEMTLKSIHIHVGDSEHKIKVGDGRKVVGEVHAVFLDTGGKHHIYTTILDQNSTAVPNRSSLKGKASVETPKLCGVSEAGGASRDAIVDAILKPAENQEYYVYTGSATTPKCKEDYTFYIAQEAKSIDDLDFSECETIAATFAQANPLPKGNYRNAQDLLDGTKLYTTTKTTTTEDSAPAALMVTAVGAALAFLL